MLIGYQGVEGSYSTVACQKFMGNQDYQTEGFLTFKLLVDALLNDKVDYIALPVENSTSGPITRTIDLMKYLNVEATAEIYVKIDHSLITKRPIELSNITKVYSHPEALEQCYSYLRQYPNIEVLEHRDTAGAVEMVRYSDDPSIASIAGSHAAEMFNMTVLRENISDNPLNTTRFLFFKKKNGHISSLNEKTTIYVETSHSTGSLNDVLSIFKKHNKNLLYLMSRPIQAKPFSYGFFIDIESGVGDESFDEALEELKDICTYINILGSYPQGAFPSYEGVIQNEEHSNN